MFEHTFVHTADMNIREKIDAAESRLKSASPNEAAGLVRKLAALKDKLFQ